MNRVVSSPMPEYGEDEYEEEYPEEMSPYPRYEGVHPSHIRPDSQSLPTDETQPKNTMNLIVREVLCCVAIALLQGGLECLSRRRSRSIL